MMRHLFRPAASAAVRGNQNQPAFAAAAAVSLPRATSYGAAPARSFAIGPQVHSGKLLCLDLEGVLIPECWVALAEMTGVEELKRTTAHEPDYDKLMRYRLNIMDEKGMGMKELNAAIESLEPLPGAVEFIDVSQPATILAFQQLCSLASCSGWGGAHQTKSG